MMRINPLKQLRGILALALLGILTLSSVTPVWAADHGDAPAVAHDLGSDINDVYLFLDPNDNTKVTLLLTVHGFIAPGENANFGVFDRALRYRLNLENTGDAKADAFIDVRFSQRLATNAVPQPQTATITLTNFGGNRTFTAPVTNPSATDGTSPTQVVTTDATSGIAFFAGLTDDPFFFDIPAFSRFTASVRAGAADLTVFTRGRDSFAGYNTLAIGFSIPAGLIRNGGNQLGVFVTTQRRNNQIYNQRTGQIDGFGQWVTVDRMAVPAVNVALIPFNSKDMYNGADPTEDQNGRFAPLIVGTLQSFGTDQTSINIFAGLAVTRGDFLRVDLTNPNSGTGGGNNVGAGFPNGRRLQDDVVDTELFLINNRRTLTDNANANDQTFGNAFPFLAPSQQPRTTGTIDDNTRN